MRREGFTLIELLIVITIIGILITLVTVSFGPVSRKSRDAGRKSDLGLFSSGIKLFESDFKIYPNYSFNLGTQGNATDDDDSSDFGLEVEVVGCNSLPADLGQSTNFVVKVANGDTAGDGTAAAQSEITTANLINKATAATKYKLKKGFAAVSHFLICLKYADRLISDKSYSGLEDYRYQVGYDYSEYLISARLENTTDPLALATLFTGGGNNGETMTNRRYYEGNGRTSRQFDEDSNRDKDDAAPGGGLYDFAGNPGAANDGIYLYQCLRDSSDNLLKVDARADSANVPIATNADGDWVANSVCQSPIADGSKYGLSATTW